ncbi:hypothetical protein [Oceanospirillum sediminis]|uniref:Uncharacterized protein n=1 Tax=Oceanospirillum sediminis TaxID=2760088 RepID=A0A839IN47_9GAMM|nr:hypothetical protein [Oceanospirillum sediminis]MBB1485897.1 hypothetical protein [Oceanospirillum sediminis]
MSCTCTQDTACDHAMPGSIEVKGDLILHEGSTLNFGCCEDPCDDQSGGGTGSDTDTYLDSVTTDATGLSTLTMNTGTTFTIQQAVTSVNGKTGDVVIDPVTLGVMPYQQLTELNQTAGVPTTVNFNTQDFSLKRDVHALILRDGSADSNIVTIAGFDSADADDFNASARTVFDGTMHPEQKQESISMINVRATGSGRAFSHMISFSELNDILVEEI